jgi:hypothetical protein
MILLCSVENIDILEMSTAGLEKEMEYGVCTLGNWSVSLEMEFIVGWELQ